MERIWMKKHITIDRFLLPAEITRALALYKRLAGTGKFASTLDAEIISPNMERINKALGQDNDSRFLAYAVEFAFMSATTKKNSTSSNDAFAEIRAVAEGRLTCKCGNDDWTHFLFVAAGKGYIAGCKKCGRTYLLKDHVWVLKGGPA
jgi:hypothetical protein